MCTIWQMNNAVPKSIRTVDELVHALARGEIPFTSLALTGPAGLGKSRWLKKNVPKAVWINALPSWEERRVMDHWRLYHIVGLDPLLFQLREELSWRCPKCGQRIVSSAYAHLTERLRRDFSTLILLGFPYFGLREVLEKKGFWRKMDEHGAAPLGEEKWLDLDVLVDRVNPASCAAGRLSEAVEQSLISGLGTVVVWCAGRRYVYGSRFSCTTCTLSADALQHRDVLGWCTGSKDAHPGWAAFSWRERSLGELLERSACEWLAPGSGMTDADRRSPWAKRLERLKCLGLGELSLGRKLKSLSSSERSLLFLGRCLEWKVSGLDFVLNHPEDGLSQTDLPQVRQVIAHLVGNSNRVWLESHSEYLIGTCALSVSLGAEQGGDETQAYALRWETLPVDYGQIRQRLQEAKPGHSGGILYTPGPGPDESASFLPDLSLEAKKILPRFFRGLERLDTDPWPRQGDDRTVLEAVGFWRWLTEALINGDEARRLRLLPSHFDRTDPLGACPSCGGNGLARTSCPTCSGSGLIGSVLDLVLNQSPVVDFWRHPLRRFAEGPKPGLFGRYAPRLRALIRAGLGEYPGMWPLSWLSHGQRMGLEMLLWLWDAPQPGVLIVEEPFRGLDRRLKREVVRTMEEWAVKGSLFFCRGSLEGLDRSVPLVF